MTYKIYKLTSPSRKSYIGISSRLNGRLRNHRHIAVSGSKGFHPLYNAIRKYGFDSFDVEVVAECDTQEEAKKHEVRLIEEFGTLAPDGYNISKGGNYDGKAGSDAVILMLETDEAYKEARREIGAENIKYAHEATRRAADIRKISSEIEDLTRSISVWRPCQKRTDAQQRVKELKRNLRRLR